ncbi:hypothetical protein GCM10010435_78180 [Winogradskya consettensis]|uniref:Uncharacterized protein n=1 Tax=Winogradskya consettensis TaxID=113560 RepID=A0A919VT45_9ACTN|nr:hypothetical protein [Actinoplanes consettensis]GIM74847.1 hypothetical protein Aco04nite_42390 [Actinoplanes consettensis]
MHEHHPIDQLVASTERAATASVADALRASSQHMADRRKWILGPPELLDDGRSLGFVLSISTARPPWGEWLDRTIDRAHLDEAKDLLVEICRVSGDHDVPFAVDFAGEPIGRIDGGRMDESLAVGLIGEWERVLDDRDQ